MRQTSAASPSLTPPLLDAHPAALRQIRADIEVTCFEYEGINAIKSALLKGVALGTEDIPIKIKLVAPPLCAAPPSSPAARRPMRALCELAASVSVPASA